MKNAQNATHYNSAKLTGILVDGLAYSHSTDKKVYFKGSLAVVRTSGKVDCIPVVVVDRVVAGLPDLQGKMVTIAGQISTCNSHEGEKSRLLVELFAYHIDVLEDGEHANNVSLCGVVCKPPVFRVTPMGREICDVMLAINRPGGRSSYIPCIVWGADARKVRGLAPGATLSVHGRFQSRIYEKKHEDGTTKKKVAYEISVSNVVTEVE